MNNPFKNFSKCVAEKTGKISERAIAFLYFRAETTDIPEASPKEINQDFQEAGLGNPNVTRLRKFLKKDSRTIKTNGDKWRLKADKLEEVAATYGEFLKNKKITVPQTDSVIPADLVSKTRGYLEEVVRQINGCYDASFYDAAGVMIRRFIETLIIEVYEHLSIQVKIQDGSGNYFMLNELIAKITSEATINLGRNAKKGLGDAKWLGDQSAHNRRFVAKKSDIDRVQPNIRILAQELISISGLK
jgi:hypothetical protein